MAKLRMKLVLDSPGIQQIMKSPEMGAEVRAQAERIAANAGDVEVVVDYDRRKKRVISMVLSSFSNERKTGGLARAMGEAGF